MDSFTNRIHDPLLFLNTDKSDLDAFLMNTSAEMAHLAEELQTNVGDVKMENSLDLDSLEGNGHLGDMNWLHNSSLSTLAHLENEDTSDGTNLISVNPQSVLPMQIIQNQKQEHFLSSESANSAAMRLHANCSSLTNSPETQNHSMQQEQLHQQQQQQAQNILRQEHQTIRILSVASQGSPHNSPAKSQNFIITSSRDSPHKPQTYVLSTADGNFPAGLTITTANSPLRGSTTGAQVVLASPQKIHTITTDKSGRVLLKSGNNLLSPSQASPVLLGRLQTGVQPQIYQHGHLSSAMPSATAQSLPPDASPVTSTAICEDRAYPKPVFSYSCLIALALKNSKNGSLPVSEIYNFMCENFPYFKTAPDGWKNSVRHNLSLNKCFAKVDNPKLSQGAKKGCLWALNPAKVSKMEEEISKWGKKDPAGLLSSMAYPENLEAIEKGQAGLHYSKKKSPDSTPCTPIKTEATHIQTDFSPVVKQEHAPMKIDKYHPNMCIEKVEPRTPVKAEYSPVMNVEYSPMQRQEYSSPAPRTQTYQKMDSVDNFLEIPVSFSSDALTDIVLAVSNTIWDEDLENNIDIDLICDSPAAGSIHPPIPPSPPPEMRSSPNLGLLPHCTDVYNQSVHPLYTNMLHGSPVQPANPSPAVVRANLFGVTTPTRRTLYT